MAFCAHSPYFTFSGVNRLARQSRRLATAQGSKSSSEPVRRYDPVLLAPQQLGYQTN